MSQIEDNSKPIRFVWMKKLFRFIGLYSSEGSNTTKPQYIFLKKCYRFSQMHLFLDAVLHNRLS